jgi:hypothetical protein
MGKERNRREGAVESRWEQKGTRGSGQQGVDGNSKEQKGVAVESRWEQKGTEGSGQ